ncbi:MAG: type II toxin-antitoxin system prevent-host-death family antitoxin [Burkholderiales bacterium]|nr:type II toxin-antitoxin system prevent-host-death family antitoxin [Burkholderiales bacterium]
MREIGAFDAKNRFGTLLDWVERGEQVVITRRGKVVARLVPGDERGAQADAQAAAERIVARRVQASLGGLHVKDLVSEGRR